MKSVSISLLNAPERASFYSFLATVISAPPTDDTVWGIRQMAPAFGLSFPFEFSLRDLSREYLQLFVVANPRLVTLDESAFRDCTSSGCGEACERTGAQAGVVPVDGASAQDLWRRYREERLACNTETGGRLGSELRFMAYLWRRQESASANESQILSRIRARFRERHLLTSIDRLSKKVSENDRLGYYATAFKVVEAVVEGDV